MTRVGQHGASIQDARVSTIHRIADEADSMDDHDARSARKARKPRAITSSAQGVLHLDDSADLPSSTNPAPRSRCFAIHAKVNQGMVEFLVSGKDRPITFEELAAACAEQLPGVVLERRTKWLQYTFDLWSHAGQCLYSIPIASMPAPEQAPATRKPRRHPSELAAHHPRG